ncbi:calcium/sodium antiporter [Parvicella tangerina]|uniref:Inner membrane protein YrbG n=1 Tax=Parvicella tangerina TaxID=2829795 RepID=A0A916JJN9_9FLAO|nr:calcium/sodium antiporter [Parvicella tangerina]CAG5078103.1 Inner membrane protein YrbG [Parvicella tangerina]
MEVLLLIAGLAVLIVGGEVLVRGAVGLSAAMKISPLVIGMTVVSFGTSAPELLVSLQSALDGNPGIAIGNVVGSNIANLALVLGITVLIFPIVAEKQTKRIDYPMMMVASLLFALFALNLMIDRWEGFVFVGVLIAFTVYLIRTSRKDEKSKLEVVLEGESADAGEVTDSLGKSLLFLLFGLVGLYFGSEWFVSGASDLAGKFGMSDSVIGVTVVAFGTSAPELVASIMAAVKKQSDISVGNLIGSNIFNIFAVLGVTSIVKPVGVDQEVLSFDMLWMLGVAAIMVVVLYLGDKIGRWKGFLLLSSYVAYISWIVIRIKS